MNTILICQSCLAQFKVPAGQADWPPCDECGGDEFRMVQDDLEDRLFPTLGDKLHPVGGGGGGSDGPYIVRPLSKPRPRVLEKAERKKSKEKHEREVYALVNRRDNWHCRACWRPVDMFSPDMLLKGHHHHVRFRSQGGPTETFNVCLLCPQCHTAVHKTAELTITGNADSVLLCEGKTRGREGRWESAA